MAKRTADEFEDGNQAYLKRQRISTNSSSSAPSNPADEIRSARQLRQILSFDQDAGRSKHCNANFPCSSN